MKLDPKKADYQIWGWVAHEDARPTDFYSQELVRRRYEIEIIGGIEDKEADYSYDSWALCKLDGKYYLLATSGCSCPSPSETWRIEIGPATLAAIRNHVINGDYDGYTMPKKQLSDFVELLDSAKKGKKKC